jgi:hypothetical protein
VNGQETPGAGSVATLQYTAASFFNAPYGPGLVPARAAGVGEAAGEGLAIGAGFRRFELGLSQCSSVAEQRFRKP